MGLSYAKVGEMYGFAKSTLCKWIKQEKLERPELKGDVAEMDGVWVGVRRGKQELKVFRDDKGGVMASFGSWEDTLTEAYKRGVRQPAHLVSDGDRAIAEAIGMVYGRCTAHQLCQFHLLREYRRNIGEVGWDEAKELLMSEDLTAARKLAAQIVKLTGGRGLMWCKKALTKGLAHLGTGQSRYKTTSRLERFQREIRRRERMGTAWTPHNLLVLLQRRGLLSSTT